MSLIVTGIWDFPCQCPLDYLFMCISFENVEQLYFKCYIHPMFHHSKWFHYIMSIILIGWLYHTKVYKARLLKHIASDTGRKHMPHYTEKMLVLCIPDVHINYPPMMIIAVTAFPPCFAFAQFYLYFSLALWKRHSQGKHLQSRWPSDRNFHHS